MPYTVVRTVYQQLPCDTVRFATKTHPWLGWVNAGSRVYHLTADFPN